MIVDAIISYARRNPGRHLGDYMERDWLKRPCPDKSCWSARVHHTLRSDHDRALHDHPWWNISAVMRGGYWEVMPGTFQTAKELGHEYFQSMDAMIHLYTGDEVDEIAPGERKKYALRGVKWRGPGAVVFRRATALHRLVIPATVDAAVSLFIMGPKTREWGFQTPGKWIHEDDYRKMRGTEV